MITAAWLKSCEKLTPEILKKSFQEPRWSLKHKVALCSLLFSTAMLAGIVHLKKKD